MATKINKWKLWLWALKHDLKPSTLAKAWARGWKTQGRIFLTCTVYGIYSSFRLLCLLLIFPEPIRVFFKTAWFVLTQTERVAQLKKFMEENGGATPKR